MGWGRTPQKRCSDCVLFPYLRPSRPIASATRAWCSCDRSRVYTHRNMLKLNPDVGLAVIRSNLSRDSAQPRPFSLRKYESWNAFFVHCSLLPPLLPRLLTPRWIGACTPNTTPTTTADTHDTIASLEPPQRKRHVWSWQHGVYLCWYQQSEPLDDGLDSAIRIAFRARHVGRRSTRIFSPRSKLSGAPTKRNAGESRFSNSRRRHGGDGTSQNEQRNRRATAAPSRPPHSVNTGRQSCSTGSCSTSSASDHPCGCRR